MPGLDEQEFDVDLFEDSQEQDQQKTAKTEELKAPEVKPVDDDVDVEVSKDPLYDRKAWKTDPAAVGKEDEDPLIAKNKRFMKRVSKLTAANHQLAGERDRYRQEIDASVEMARAWKEKYESLTTQHKASSVSSLKSQIDTWNTKASLAEKEYQDALNLADAKKVAEAATKLAEAKTNASIYARQVEQEEKALPVKEDIPVARQQQVVQQQPETQDTPPRLKTWLQRNAWFDRTGQDPMSKYALSLDAAINSRIAEGTMTKDFYGSDKYFALIDKKLRDKFPDNFGVSKSQAIPPPSGRTPNQQTNTVKGGKITLTPSQVEALKRIHRTDTLTPEMKKSFARELLAKQQGQGE